MTTQFDPSLFPPQLFPDVELQNVSLDRGRLTISVSDSGWGLWTYSEDRTLFYDEGAMMFSYKDAASLQWKNLHEKFWREGGQELLPRLAALEFIRRNPDDGSLLFQFSNRERGFLLAVLLKGVESVAWTGEADKEQVKKYL